MQSILDAINEWIKEILIGTINGNLSTMFGDVNEKVGTIAVEVGQTPQGWNASIFSMIQTLSENVIIPLAGLVITYVLCVELISMVTEKNNMHDVDTFMFFKWFFKAWVAVYLVTHTFDITMAVFDVAQRVVSGAAGVIGGNTNIDVTAALSSMQDGLNDMEIPELLLLVMETSLVSLCMKIMSVLITVILYGRIYNNKNTFSEWYSGHENDIPKEYRVMSFPQPERPDPAKVEMDAAAPPQQSVPPDAAQEPRPVIPIVLTSEKPAGKLKEITDRLEQGIMELFDSDRYKEYLRVMSKFHNYSFNNTLLIAMQKPDASLVAGFQSWKNNFKRNVVKGEKGIKILAPSPFKIKQEMEKIDPATQKPVIGADGKPVKEEKEITIPAFKVVSVFDVSQTEGKELPDIAVDMLTGDVECFKDVFAALEKTSPVPIGFEKIEGNSHGYYHLEEKRIAIDEGMSELQTIKTAIHEIAHAKLHDIDPNAPKEERAGRPDRRTREVQAESVAYAVCQHYGLDTSDYSFGYVAGWSSGRELDELKSSLETIRSTAAEIINSIDEHLQEIQKERDKEQAQKGTTIEAAEPDKDTFSIYQLKRGDETRDFRFEPYDRLAATGHTAEQTNYDLIYTAELAPGTSLEDIYTRFNIDHPKDFKGHSLSVSDVVVLHQNGQDTAHYVDSSGYRQVPEFLQPPEKENPLKHVEDTIEQNDNHFDGIINNTPSVDELEKKAKSREQISLTDLADAIKAEKMHGKGKEEKPSIRAQLKADKKKAQKKTARQKSQNLERS